jgi:PTS system nitrogen regulatory IIA component
MTAGIAGENSLAALIERGGVYHDVPGSSPREILDEAAGLLPVSSLKKDALVQAMLEREALMSTGIGRGIALPHPRTPALEKAEDAFVAIVFPAQPLEWHAPDGGAVHTLFLIVSSSPKQHLDSLSKINFLCQQEKFYALIKGRALKETIVAGIREAEISWAQSS